MKLKIVVALLAVALAWFAGRHFYTNAHGGGNAPGSGLSFGDQVRAAEQVVNESHKLNPGASVIVSGIRGPVEIKTGDGDTAEVHVVNNVSDARYLEMHKISVEYAPDRLAVSAANKHAWGPFDWMFGGSGKATQSVTLVLPRRVELRVSGTRGDLTVGELDGSLKVSGVNGRVEVARASGRADVSGVNGGVVVGLANLGGEGVRVSGVNGPVELRFPGDANADVRAGGINGPIDTAGLSNVTVEDEGRSKLVARIGAGGSPVKLGGINGGLTLKNN